ncbi:hypothetical protein KKC17_02960 [Patescibacteria group bacterium]|nr:hypothetical protein [Patescibacteria group bacterium]
MKQIKIPILWQSLIQATGLIVYIVGVSWLLQNGQRLFGDDKNLIGPIALLLLLVISASLSGLLVLGRPITLYLNNFKKTAWQSLAYTISWLILGLIILLLI